MAKPYGDSERYDFILEAGHRLSRIQVKGTTTLRNGRYHVNCHRRTHGGLVPYQPEEIDFIVAHVIPEDSWFIVPIAVAQGHTTLLLAPRDYPLTPGLYGAYREAWHLLREIDGGTRPREKPLRRAARTRAGSESYGPTE
ncbi:MAG: hypothetical protein LAO56_03440 [Acidobacteriia bacterium]|nr:hypothetical protein [Terriglobia bacterium]